MQRSGSMHNVAMGDGCLQLLIIFDAMKYACENKKLFLYEGVNNSFSISIDCLVLFRLLTFIIIWYKYCLHTDLYLKIIMPKAGDALQHRNLFQSHS